MHAFFFFQAEDGIRDLTVTGVQTCALPISLAKAKDWIRYSDKATRETNVMPQWAGSCWYYIRFCDPGNDQRFVGGEAERYWMGGENDEARMSNDEGRTKPETRKTDEVDRKS